MDDSTQKALAGSVLFRALVLEISESIKEKLGRLDDIFESTGCVFSKDYLMEVVTNKILKED